MIHQIAIPNLDRHGHGKLLAVVMQLPFFFMPDGNGRGGSLAAILIRCGPRLTALDRLEPSRCRSEMFPRPNAMPQKSSPLFLGPVILAVALAVWREWLEVSAVKEQKS